MAVINWLLCCPTFLFWLMVSFFLRCWYMKNVDLFEKELNFYSTALIFIYVTISGTRLDFFVRKVGLKWQQMMYDDWRCDAYKRTSVVSSALFFFAYKHIMKFVLKKTVTDKLVGLFFFNALCARARLFFLIILKYHRVIKSCNVQYS